MGGRGASRRGGGGGSGSSAGGAGSPVVTAQQAEEHVAAQVDKLPGSVADVLVREGVTYQVIDRSTARRTDPKAVDLAGWYNLRTKTAYVVFDADRGVAGLQDIGMTVLHELGHAYHVATGAAFTSEFDQAYAAGLSRVSSTKTLTASQKRRLTYQDYDTEAERQTEVWSESFAVVYGEGRPKPATNWNNSRQFRKIWAEAVDVVRRQTRGEK